MQLSDKIRRCDGNFVEGDDVGDGVGGLESLRKEGVFSAKFGLAGESGGKFKGLI